MHGPILTMPSVFDTTSEFTRSHSSSNIPDLLNVEYRLPATQHGDELPRAASFNCLEALGDPQGNIETKLQRVHSADAPPASALESHGTNDASGRDGKAGGDTLSEEPPKLERLGRRKSLVTRPKSWMHMVRGSPERQKPSESVYTTPSNTPPVPPISTATRERAKTVSESFATFARKSWITSSRSPSPHRNLGKEPEYFGRDGDPSKTIPRRPVMRPTKIEKPLPAKSSDSPPKSMHRSSTNLLKMKQKPPGVLMNFTMPHSTNSSTSSLPRSSVDNRSTPRTSTDRVPPIPKTLSMEKTSNQAHDIPRRKDELWLAFRSLENDFSKFQSKTWSLKTNVVRSALLPFLRNHASHPSHKSLRPEDLDRRVNILNKWWIGLLEVLDGRQNQSVSGVDRPVLLDAVIAIMGRPEWRLAPDDLAPLSDRSPDHLLISRKKSSSSLDSSASQFVIESTYHNVRNLFIQNLLSQMSYVVDKMSLRHAPASLVTFCGRAAAYAFFFVPGIAEVLVRIWKLQADTLRRAADELGLPRRLDKIDSGDVAATFPSHIQSLGWLTARSMTAQLRQRSNLSVFASKIPWYGPWVARWRGSDSDLFFVFAKHYHILAEEFMSPDLTLAEKARSPGFVLVHAQILTTLDATLHRQPPGEPLPINFDDVLAGVDATAGAIPLPSSNSARMMAENRLIMLLRDFMSERPSEFELARMTFAEAFAKMMQAAARRTSLFDHNACLVLCDFMEEALALFIRFHQTHTSEPDFIDWPFWLDVCKKMLNSHNSMSEIRLFSFIYGSWSLITNNERRKEILCLDWLVAEDTFEKFFNHWCPMVRAYYMRFLCWRLCREDGDATDLDTKIFFTISKRVKANWSLYVQLKTTSERANTLPPSTAPCQPAPGRRLLIIRNDSPTPTSSLFFAFDGIGPSSSTGIARRHSSLAAGPNLDTIDNTPKLTVDSTSTPIKKRWTLMGKLLPSTSASSDPSTLQNHSRVSSPTKTLEDARRETALARSRPSMQAKAGSGDAETPASTSSYRAYSFKFCLEWTQGLEKLHEGGGQPTGNGNIERGGVILNIGGERRLSPPRLPGPAQARLSATVASKDSEDGASFSVVDREGNAREEERDSRAKYVGRALAEWAMVVIEYNNFIERRKVEGVPNLKLMEVPTLGVEAFRRFG